MYTQRRYFVSVKHTRRGFCEEKQRTFDSLIYLCIILIRDIELSFDSRYFRNHNWNSIERKK